MDRPVLSRDVKSFAVQVILVAKASGEGLQTCTVQKPYWPAFFLFSTLQSCSGRRKKKEKQDNKAEASQCKDV